MSHFAAIIPAGKALLEIQEVKTPQPGPDELLVKNEIIALIPIDAKLAKFGVFPIPYPAILGTSFGGTVISVGSAVTNFQVGDKVAAAKTAGATGDKYGAFQTRVIAREVTTSKLLQNVNLGGPVGLIGNLSTVVGLFNVGAGLERPETNGPASAKGKKILVYGGTSSFGSLAVQYLRQAGYDIVTTTSPKHKVFVSKLGAVQVVDHTQNPDALREALIAKGPYDLIVDSISITRTIKVTSGVVAAQGGGKLYTLLPPSSADIVAPGVTTEFASWSAALAEEKNAGLLHWAFGTYFPLAIANNRLIPQPTQAVDGGLGGLNEALDILSKGVSGVKVVVPLSE